MFTSNAKYDRSANGFKNRAHLQVHQDDELMEASRTGPVMKGMDISGFEIPLLRELHYLNLAELEE